MVLPKKIMRRQEPPPTAPEPTDPKPEQKEQNISFSKYIEDAPSHVKDFYNKCIEYFSSIDEKNRQREIKWEASKIYKNRQYRKIPYTHSGLFIYLGIDGKIEWDKYKSFAEYAEYHRAVAQAELVIESQLIDALMTEDLNRAGAELYLKHQYGMNRNSSSQTSGGGAIQINFVTIQTKEQLDAFRKAGSSDKLLKEGNGILIPSGTDVIEVKNEQN